MLVEKCNSIIFYFYSTKTFKVKINMVKTFVMELIREEIIDGKKLKLWLVKPKQKRTCDICDKEMQHKPMVSLREGKAATILTECMDCYNERVLYERELG